MPLSTKSRLLKFVKSIRTVFTHFRLLSVKFCHKYNPLIHVCAIINDIAEWLEIARR